MSAYHDDPLFSPDDDPSYVTIRLCRDPDRFPSGRHPGKGSPWVGWDDLLSDAQAGADAGHAGGENLWWAHDDGGQLVGLMTLSHADDGPSVLGGFYIGEAWWGTSLPMWLLGVAASHCRYVGSDRLRIDAELEMAWVRDMLAEDGWQCVREWVGNHDPAHARTFFLPDVATFN